jgi:hypothetical protein
MDLQGSGRGLILGICLWGPEKTPQKSSSRRKVYRNTNFWDITPCKATIFHAGNFHGLFDPED